MNDLVVDDPTVIPVVYRPRVSAISKKLQANISGWDNDVWDIRNWYNQTAS
jgi:peptide/nickel transport system substrate-binding protein